jgi:hydroxymethylpyrimidine pyrophosphatase-like HAD family hydrolase
MSSRIRLLSTDFDGTLVSHLGEPALDRRCMELIRELQDDGANCAINTGR